MSRRQRGAAGLWALVAPLLMGVGPGAGTTAKLESTELPFSSRFGGAEDDIISDVALDRAGNIYITGWTGSTKIGKPGGVQTEFAGGKCAFFSTVPCGDAFVAKFNSKDHSLVYSTYLGGTESDAAHSISVDDSGNAYVAGQTGSATIAGHKAAQPPGGKLDAFVAKLTPSGGELVYLTTLGGDADDIGKGIAVDGGGNAYVAGSAGPGLQIAGGFKPAAGGEKDGFVAKLNPADGKPVYSTYLGGSASDAAHAVALDPAGNAYVTGETDSADFPAIGGPKGQIGGGTCGVDDPTISYLKQISATQQWAADALAVMRRTLPPRTKPCSDAFAARLDKDGGRLFYSTFIGGKAADAGNDITVDKEGSAYITGSAGPGFPITNRVGRSAGKSGDAFVAKFEPSGSRIAYSAYIGGPGADTGSAIALRSGTIFVAGRARSGLGVRNALQPVSAGRSDAFLAALRPSAGRNSLVSSTYLGGSGRDEAKAIAVARSGEVLVTGLTGSPSDFPFSRPNQKMEGGQLDAFLHEVDVSRQGPVINTVSPQSGPPAGGIEVVITGRGLGDVKRVLFGDVPASKVDAGETRMTVRAPRNIEGTAPLAVETSAGRSAPAPAAAFEYAPGAWRAAPAPPGHRHSATLLPDGKVLLAGGCARLQASGDCLAESALRSSHLFDPGSDQWRRSGRMVTARFGHTATLLPQGPAAACGTNCGKVLLVGGDRAEMTAELFDPKTGKWTATGAPAPSFSRTGHTATLLSATPASACGQNCGKVLLVGGSNSGPSKQLFDPKTGAWSRAEASTAIPAGARLSLEQVAILRRVHHTATLLKNGKVLIIGGLVSQAPAELFDPASGRATPAPNPTFYRYAGHTANLLPNEMILLVGGMTDNVGRLALSTEMLDPKGTFEAGPSGPGPWLPAGNLRTTRYAHTSTTLSDGRVLVAGGSDALGDRTQPEEMGSSLNTTEIYGASNNAWKPAGRMTKPRGAAIALEQVGPVPAPLSNATLLKDGRVLITGGASAAELYDPIGRPAIRPQTGGFSLRLALIAIAGLGAAAMITAYAVTRRRIVRRRS